MKKGISKACPQCSTVFYQPPSRGEQITCSRQCRARFMQDKGAMVPCLGCGTEFWRTQSSASRGYGNYCSHKCWGKTRKTPHGKINNSWKPWQRRAWKQKSCARCGATSHLELDHIIASSLGGKSTKENTQTLCKVCNLRKYQLEDLPKFLLANTNAQ